VRALALHPQTGDFDTTSGRLTVVEGLAAIAQRLDGCLSLWQGTWFANTAAGVPFRSFMGEKNRLGLARLRLRQAIVGCTGIAALESFSLDFDGRTRKASCAFRARTVDGDIIERGPFIAGAL